MKLLILSSSTGGGHDMRANALRSWWTEGRGEARIMHPLENGFALYRLGSGLYNFIQRKLPLFHYLYFYFLEYASMHRGTRRIISSGKFSREVSGFSPDLVLSVHAHLNHGYFDLARKAVSHGKSKFVIFCGELADGQGFSRHWVNPAADLFTGPFEETCLAARKRGMPEGKTLVTGPLLRKPFYQSGEQPGRAEFLAEYDLSENLKTYVLGTGANGVNRHREVIDAFNRSDVPCQLLALCGKNLRTLDELESLKRQSKVPLVPLPKQSACNMAMILRHADCLFARPGAGMTTEAIACGTPVIFDVSRGVMPQETNNLNFWKKHAPSLIKTARPSRLPELVAKEVPSVRIRMDSGPRKLLGALDQLVSE
ncbi:UDP-N-acetylglucosamine--LPS N-acetylglucosamine transferase [Verrucomicrobia bacterium]|nr:UDP-N-acetylglucosamine--LPS N-acetylglucosamine transferase [Verrucomicrobiota bacterium]